MPGYEQRLVQIKLFVLGLSAVLSSHGGACAVVLFAGDVIGSRIGGSLVGVSGSSDEFDFAGEFGLSIKTVGNRP